MKNARSIGLSPLHRSGTGTHFHCAERVASDRQRLFRERPSRHDQHSSQPNDAPQETSALCCVRPESPVQVCVHFHPASNFVLRSLPDRYWPLWVSCPCSPVRFLQPLLRLCLPCWLHRYQGQLLSTAGLELVRLSVQDNPLAIFLQSTLSAALREVSYACPPLVNFKANLDVRLWIRN